MISSLSDKNKDFFEQVYAVVQEIPFGRVTSYGAIAKYLGSGQSSRMVGWALNACHHRPEIPAHRVVNRNGILTGKMHFSTPDFMQNQLEIEGIKVHNDKIIDFDIHFWNPEIELKL